VPLEPFGEYFDIGLFFSGSNNNPCFASKETDLVAEPLLAWYSDDFRRARNCDLGGKLSSSMSDANRLMVGTIGDLGSDRSSMSDMLDMSSGEDGLTAEADVHMV